MHDSGSWLPPQATGLETTPHVVAAAPENVQEATSFATPGRALDYLPTLPMADDGGVPSSYLQVSFDGQGNYSQHYTVS